MTTPKRYLLLLPLVSLVGTLIFLEVGLRTYDLVRGHGFFNSVGNQLSLPMRQAIPFRTFGFDPYVNTDVGTMISDRWGRQFPLEKTPGTFRIVCFGGSTTENRDEVRNYPAYLQEELRQRTGRGTIEVINVGNSAYATPHALLLLELDVLSWQPDLLILSHNVNDLLVTYWPDFRPDYWNKYSHSFYAYPDYSHRYSWNNVVFQHSRLYWFLSDRIRKLSESSEVASVKLQRESSDPDRVRQARDVFERNLESFLRIADRPGIRVLLGTQPLEPSEEYFLKHMAFKPYNDIVTYPLHDEFVDHHAAYNQVIRDVSERMNAGLVDNDAMFDRDTEYFKDHVHYTESGLRKLASNYATFIQREYLNAVEPEPTGTPPGSSH